MQNEIVQFFFQYLFAFIGCCSSYWCGIFLLRFLPLDTSNGKNKWFQAYCAIILGLTTFILLYSILFTKGRTINIIIIPVLLVIFFSRKSKQSNFQKEDIPNKWPLLFLLTMPCFFVLLFHLFPESEYKQMDSLFYLQISQSLNTVGQENGAGGMAVFGAPYVGTGQYHYFEFWLNAILLKCFGSFLPGIQLLRFSCYAIISTTGVLGLFAFAENILKTPLSFRHKTICILFVFYWPNLLAAVELLRPVLIYSIENNFIERPNLRTLYLFMPGLLIMIGQNKYKWQSLFWIAWLLIASLLYFGAFVPAILLFLLILLKIKEGNKSYLLSVLGGSVCLAVLFVLFYHFTQADLQDHVNNPTQPRLTTYFLRYWKIILFSTATSICYCLMVPALLFAWLKTTKDRVFYSFLLDNKTIIIFCVVIIFASIGIARLLNFTENSYQFAFVGYSFGAILFFMLLLFATKTIKIKIWVYGCICTALVVTFLYPRLMLHQGSYENIFSQNGKYHYGGKKFSVEYLNQISNVFAKKTEVIGGYWADSLFYDTIPYYSNRNPSSYTLPSGYVLANKLKYNYEVCLSDSASIMYKIDTTQKSYYNYLRFSIIKSPFYQYSKKGTENQKKLAFIKNYKLQYLIVTKNADTSILRQLPILNRFQDKNTGEQFFLLDVTKF